MKTKFKKGDYVKLVDGKDSPIINYVGKVFKVLETELVDDRAFVGIDFGSLSSDPPHFFYAERFVRTNYQLEFDFA